MSERHHPALLQCAQHEFLYFGSKNDHPFLARFAKDSPSAPRKTAGTQPLISQPGIGPRLCASCIRTHVPLYHILAHSLETQLVINYPNFAVDLCLVGTSVRKASLGSDLGNYSSQYLQDELPTAYRRSCIYDRGNVAQLADWERDWQATREQRI